MRNFVSHTFPSAPRRSSSKFTIRLPTKLREVFCTEAYLARKVRCA